MDQTEIVKQTLEVPTKISSLQRWIETGYRIIAHEGIDAIQVERLAREIALNKSGFYHYFGTRIKYLDALMGHHRNEVVQMATMLSEVNNFDPDYFYVLLQFKTTVLFHMQLVRHRHDRFLIESFHRINEIIDPMVIPAWANFIGQQHNHELAKRYYQIFRELMYSRITPDNLNIEHLTSTGYEIKLLLSVESNQ